MTEINELPPPVDLIAESTQFQLLFASNKARMQTLAAQGIGFNLQDAYFEAILDELLPRDSQRRLDFAIGWEQQMAGFLDEAESQVRQQQLLAGVHVEMPRVNGQGAIV